MVDLHAAFALITHPEAMADVLARDWLLGLAIVCAIVLLETGVVVFPFLPGDSLLFALGAFLVAGEQSPLTAWAAVSGAAVLGDLLNYTIGHTAVGPWILRRGWIRDEHVQRTRHYFARYGGSAITVARFVPVVRTIAPFLAGVSDMPLRRFVAFNVLGGCAWAALLIGLGMGAGRLPWVQEHFSLVTIGIVAISVVPLAIQWMRARRG